MLRAPTRLLLCLTLLACTSEPYDGITNPIINGTPATGLTENWTVAIYNAGISTGSAGLCTGTVISPYAVLTAKHCVYSDGVAVPASDFLVFDTNTLNGSAEDIRQRRNVREWRSTPGAFRQSDLGNGTDIAIILLTEPFDDITPRQIRRTRISAGSGFLVGFGRTSTNIDVMSSGVKYTGNTNVLGYDRRTGRTIVAGRTSWTCQGDSGGPLLMGGEIVGVTSFGLGQSCDYYEGFFTPVVPHLAMIDEAIAFAPPCEPSREICDGEDNNCDGVIDEGCTRLGDSCTTPTQCGDGLCEDVGGTDLCVRECNPASNVPTCPLRFHCAETGCGTGRCLAGSEGARADGDECDNESQCYSRRCVNVAGTMRCGRQCDTSDCGEGLVCEDIEGCSTCIRAEDSTRPRVFGSVCDDDAQCLSMDCTAGEGTLEGFCSASCSTDDPCGAGFHCRAGRCEGGNAREVGEGCVHNDDCLGEIECVTVDGDQLCASTCDEGCPGDFECSDTSAGPRCVVGGLALGESCIDASECRSGICLGTCTRICDDLACPSHLECREAGPVSGCFPPTGDGGGGGDEEGGCSVSTLSATTGPTAPWLLLLGLLGIRRSTRRRP